MVAPAGAAAQGSVNELQPHESIRQAAEMHLLESRPRAGQRIAVEVGSLDPRLRLARCDAPLETFEPPGTRTAGRVSVGVRCTSPRPWKLYLPATVQLFAPVVVAARPLLRGGEIGNGDVVLAEREIGSLTSGYLDDPSQALGMKLRRTVAAGDALSPRGLAPPLWVRRGERIVLVAGSGEFEVRMSGTALSEGARDQTVRVKNTRSNRIVEGVVESPGVVRVRM